MQKYLNDITLIILVCLLLMLNMCFMRSISISNTQLALALLIVFFKKDLQSLNLTYSTPTIPNISITFIEH